jgi:hypothetical protein
MQAGHSPVGTAETARGNERSNPLTENFIFGGLRRAINVDKLDII